MQIDVCLLHLIQILSIEETASYQYNCLVDIIISPSFEIKFKSLEIITIQNVMVEFNLSEMRHQLLLFFK